MLWPPFLPLIIAALGCLVLPRKMSALLIPAAAATTLLAIYQLPTGDHLSWAFLDYELHPLKVDNLSRIFGLIFALITAIGGIYALDLFSKLEQIVALLYAAGALAVTFAGDAITLYFGWEMMAVASFFLIAAREKNRSRRAAVRYFFVHLAGGVLLVAGILIELHETQSILLNSFATTSAGPGAWLILAGVAVNAAVVPLHAWLPDAYPKATIGGAVLLSALTTKTAVYSLARLFPGWELLIILGIIMALYGVIFAFLADDIRLVLAYHIVSQVGFMVAGIGLGSEMAINGAVAHAFCHILYKALLFMATGAVLYATGKSRLSELGGLYQSLRWVFLLYMVGAVSISGWPLFNGFVSKSMTIDAAGELHHYTAVTLLYIASVGTFLSVGLKLPYFAWFSKPQRARQAATPRKPISHSMYLGMGITALLCITLGVYPDLLYRALPYPVHYKPYTLAHVLHACAYLIGTGLAFALYLPKIKMKWTYLIDTDWFYRRPVALYRAAFVDIPANFFGWVERCILQLVTVLTTLSRNPSLAFKTMGEPSEDYDPERQRLPLAWTVSAILGTTLFLGLWLLFSG